MNNEKLKSMYGSTPQSFENRIRYTLEKAERAPARHLPLRTALIAACITLLSVSAGLALFSSQVAQFFGGQVAKEIEAGRIALSGDSVALRSAVFTLDEAAYIDSGLYAVGHAKALSDDVLLLADMEQLPEQTALRPVFVSVVPEKIAVGGGDMLPLTDLGYSYEALTDGTLQFGFTLPTGVAVTNGQTYTIDFLITLCDVSPAGELLEDTRTVAHWQATVAPVAVATATPAPQETPIPTVGGVQVITPESYQKTGTLPIYKAQPRTEENTAFFSIDPAFFNASGVQSHTTRDQYYREENYVFSDEARLRVTGITLEYAEYEGEYTIYYKLEGQSPDGPHPFPAFSSAVADLGYRAYWQHPEETLAHTALGGHTLDEAKQLAAQALEMLGLNDYALSYALDMNTERIAHLGALATKEQAAAFYNYDRSYDYAAADESDEGFFLLFEKQVHGIPAWDENRSVRIFVSGGVIRCIEVDSVYMAGDLLATPARLMTAEEAVAAFARDHAARERHGICNPTLTSLTLTYMPARAQNAADGMVYLPVWHAQYTFADGGDLCNCQAWYSAIDGTLLKDDYTIN